MTRSAILQHLLAITRARSQIAVLDDLRVVQYVLHQRIVLACTALNSIEWCNHVTETPCTAVSANGL